VNENNSSTTSESGETDGGAKNKSNNTMFEVIKAMKTELEGLNLLSRTSRGGGGMKQNLPPRREEEDDSRFDDNYTV
jgi:hypothetical protein